MRKVRIWFRANLFGWPYWRVTYKNGESTVRLHKAEARGLAGVSNGKMWIDYTIKYDI